MNLIKNNKVFHRELFKQDGKTLLVKDEFILQDLWAYYYISFAGKGQTRGSAYLSVEEEQLIKANLLADIPELSTKEADYLLSLVERIGLDAVLFAIDSLADETSESFPNVEELRHYTKDAILYLKHLRELEQQ